MHSAPFIFGISANASRVSDAPFFINPERSSHKTQSYFFDLKQAMTARIASASS